MGFEGIVSDEGACDAINTICRFLAQVDDDATPDLIILAGNAILHTSEACFRLAARLQAPLLISGGIGHSTDLLYQAVAGHPVYGDVATAGRSEAEILRDIAVRHWRLDAAQVWVETQSTNCGDNAVQSRAHLEARGVAFSRALLVQDPLMQRRSGASFARVWQDGTMRFINWPAFVPQLSHDDGRIAYRSDMPPGLWTPDRFVSLLMGEIPRLRDDASGYGPNGRGFITHVDIPAEVEAAYAYLQARVGMSVR